MSYDLIRAILLRPQMYTATESFLEIVAFLEGYYSGLAKDPRAQAQVERWGNFQRFVTLQQDDQISNVWAVLRRQYGEQALWVFKTLYDDFCRL